MASIAVKIIAFVVLICVIGISIVGIICGIRVLRGPGKDNFEYLDGWGDTSGSRHEISMFEWKIPIPFWHREVEVSFSGVSFNQFLIRFIVAKVHLMEYTFHSQNTSEDILGIKVEWSHDGVDGTCKPTVEIIRGGVGQTSAGVKITSARGCGFYTMVEFFNRPSDQY